jgi:hypothetical protein
MIIYKYNFPVGNVITPITLPFNCKILTINYQYNSPVIYALVDTNRATITRTIYSFYTGQEIDSEILCDLDYIGTYTHNSLVYHVFISRE